MFYIIFAFIGGFLLRSMISSLFNSIFLSNKMRELEVRFLLLAASYIELRSYSITILEIVYGAAQESGIKNKEEFLLAKQKIEEKYNTILDLHINNMSQYIPYDLEYSNWAGASVYIDKVKKEAKKLRE